MRYYACDSCDKECTKEEYYSYAKLSYKYRDYRLCPECALFFESNYPLLRDDMYED